jgi:DNA-directed RNA polymerase specialized sigma subunit
MAEYVNGKEFFEELKVYRALCDQAKIDGLERPPITDKIASAIVRISNKLSNSWNFNGYTYKDEMVSDGILKCIEKIHNFDPQKGENGFAFATQIIFNAFINRIKLEQKEMSVRARMIKEKMSSEFVEHGASIDNEDTSNAFVQFLKDNEVFVDYIAEKKERETTVHPSLVHRNKSYTPKKSVDVQETAVDLCEFV